MSRPGRPISNSNSDSDWYSTLLGPHAAALERRVDELLPRMMGKDQDWYSEQRSRVEQDPFEQLRQIGFRAEQRQLDYAAERVAVAIAAARLPASEGSAPSAPSPTPAEMLEAYERDLGKRGAERVGAESRFRFLEAVQYQDAESVQARSLQLVDPYPSSQQLEQEVANWVADEFEPAATLAALTTAERETFSRNTQ